MNYKHDERLDLLKPGQYRIWHDGQNILVPVGQSTTKPLTKEIVNANTRVYGEIHNGFFNRPLVDFTNTNVDIERFDRYYLQTWREGEELPADDPRIDYHFDLGLDRLHLMASITFDVFADDVTHQGEYNGFPVLSWYQGETWHSEILRFDNYGLQSLNGEFFIVVNPLPEHTQRGKLYTTPFFIQEQNLPVSIIVTRAQFDNGNSKMRLQLKNTEMFPFSLFETDFTVLGGE